MVVRGGASAVGTAAIQLAVAAGARVLAIAGGAGEGTALPRPRRRGRDRPHLRGRLRRGHGRDRRPRAPRSIFDPIGGEQTETMWTCGARGGRYLAVGFNDDPESGPHRPPAAQGVDGQRVGPRRAARLPRRAARLPPLRHQPVPARDGRAGARRAARAGRRRAASGRPIGRRIGLDEVAAALEDHAARRTSGRTVVEIARR